MKLQENVGKVGSMEMVGEGGKILIFCKMKDVLSYIKVENLGPWAY